MKLYDAKVAPNPRRVRIFLAEKGMTIPTELIDLGKLQHKEAEFTAINPVQRVPALVLDDGTVLTESIAICRYLEWLQPEPCLFGQPGLEAAVVEMWQRTVEFHLLATVAHVFRHLHPAMRDMEVPQVPDWAEANKPRVLDFLRVLDERLKDNAFIAGERFSVADITAMVAMDFLRPARLTMPAERTSVLRWHREVAARPSASA